MQKERIWLALQRAAERIGRAEHAAGRYKVARRGGRVVRGYTLSEAHRRVIDTMNALGADKITPEQAMAVLHEYDVLQARTRHPLAKSRSTERARTSERGKSPWGRQPPMRKLADILSSSPYKNLTLDKAAYLADRGSLTGDFYTLSDSQRGDLGRLMARTRWRQSPASRAGGVSQLRAFHSALRREASQRGVSSRRAPRRRSY